MSSNLSGTNPLSYLGVQAVTPPQLVKHARAPTTEDYKNFRIGAIWVDTSSEDAYMLTDLSQNVATWVLIGGTSGAVERFLVSSGTSPVIPDASNQITLTDGNAIAYTGGTNAWTLDVVSPFTGDFTFTDSTSGATETVTITNTSDTASSAAQLAVNVAGTTASDPYASFGVGSTISYSLGIDNTDDYIKINTAVAATVTPSTGTNIWLMDSSGNQAGYTYSLGHSTPVIDNSFTVNGIATTAVLSLDAEGGNTLAELANHRHSDTAAISPFDFLLRTRGTNASPTIVQSGDALGTIYFGGWDGTDYALGAQITANVDGTPGANDMPGNLKFYTSPDGSQTPTIGLTISSTQAVTIANDLTSTAGNINLPSTNAGFTQGTIFVNSSRFIHSFGTNNTFMGDAAGNGTLTGINNTGVGQSNLPSVTDGNRNCCLGAGTFSALTGGDSNIAIGPSAVNTLTTGDFNIGIGDLAWDNLATGSYNVGIGANCGSAYTTSESSNIIIGHSISGTIGDSNVCRIGNGTGTSTGQLNQTFISGIRGITTGAMDAVAVLVDSANQLGTISSSIVYKENVNDMEDASSAIYDLRPVTFNYKKDENKTLQYGLIAEEVEKIFPKLVVYQNGEILSIKYHDLPVLLLNEIIKLNKRLKELETIKEQL